MFEIWGMDFSPPTIVPWSVRHFFFPNISSISKNQFNTFLIIFIFDPKIKYFKNILENLKFIQNLLFIGTFVFFCYKFVGLGFYGI